NITKKSQPRITNIHTNTNSTQSNIPLSPTLPINEDDEKSPVSPNPNYITSLNTSNNSIINQSQQLDRRLYNNSTSIKIHNTNSIPNNNIYNSNNIDNTNSNSNNYDRRMSRPSSLINLNRR